MSLLKAAKWLAVEMSGASASRRLLVLIFRKEGYHSRTLLEENLRTRISIHSFFAAAETVVLNFGPESVRRRVFGKYVGTWLLAGIWLLPPTVLIYNELLSLVVTLMEKG